MKLELVHATDVAPFHVWNFDLVKRLDVRSKNLTENAPFDFLRFICIWSYINCKEKSRKRAKCKNNFIDNQRVSLFSFSFKIIFTWTCRMALGFTVLKARLNDSKSTEPSSPTAARQRAWRSAPTKPWAAWATLKTSSSVRLDLSVELDLSVVRRSFVRIDFRAIVVGTLISISTSSRPSF